MIPESPAPLAIRRARLMLGLTQAQAGAIVYRTMRTWNSWERGNKPMDPLVWEIWQVKSAKVAKGEFPRGKSYIYCGLIERGNGKPGYDWREGYSAEGPHGEVAFPWQTYRECQREAKADGCVARFKR